MTISQAATGPQRHNHFRILISLFTTKTSRHTTRFLETPQITICSRWIVKSNGMLRAKRDNPR
ncbi:MAG TPA: hypothetical protein VII92_09260, partial [Anaerolineae bacterium]